MPKIIEQWLLFKYIEGEFTPLSKPFKTNEQAEKARLKLPEREQRSVGGERDSAETGKRSIPDAPSASRSMLPTS
jgi:hypothetical protein